MMWPAKIESAELPEHGRIAVISDIHGNLPYLRALLDKLAALDVETLTPLEALTYLYDCKQELMSARRSTQSNG